MLARCIALTMGFACAILSVSPAAEAKDPVDYEVWGSDQSNSVPGAAGLGLDGSQLWIWHSDDVEEQARGGVAAEPIPCAGTGAPCDTNLVFPASLVEHDENNVPTG